MVGVLRVSHSNWFESYLSCQFLLEMTCFVIIIYWRLCYVCARHDVCVRFFWNKFLSPSSAWHFRFPPWSTDRWFQWFLLVFYWGRFPCWWKFVQIGFEKKMPFSEPWSNSSPRTDDPVVGFHRVFPFHGWRRGAISKPMILRISNSLQSSLWGLGAPFLVLLGSRYDVFMFGYLFGGNTTYGRSVN